MRKTKLKKESRFATAFAPATVANVAVGYDILGFALEGLGERVRVERLDGQPEVIIDPVAGYPEVSCEPGKNTAGAGLLALIKDKKLKFGFRVQLVKSIPIGSGLGGSSTSAVASIVAANALLEKKLNPQELLEYSLIGETVASGSRHGDNVGPCLLGGLQFIRTYPELLFSRIDTPRSLKAVILLPRLSIKTQEARSLLRPEVSMKALVEQTAGLAGFILGCMKGDRKLIQKSMSDVIIEPQRSSLIPGFQQIQEAAKKAGALGCSISGSGPALFAWASHGKAAEKIQKAMLGAARKEGLLIFGSWISPISKNGAYLLKSRETQKGGR